VVAEPPSNVDMLAWFSDDERGPCPSCGERTCVTPAEAFASFCLACGAIVVNGQTIPPPRKEGD
jgi:hypothetical protein